MSERASRLHTELRCRLVAGRYRDGAILIPERGGVLRRGYFFKPRDPKRAAISIYGQEDNELKREIELFMRVNGEYFVVETHIGKKRCGVKSVNARLKPERVDEILTIGEIYAGKRPLMIAVVPPETINLAARESSKYRAFVESGGGLVPFYTTAKEWKKEVAKLMHEACKKIQVRV